MGEPASVLHVTRLQETDFKRISALDLSFGTRTLVVLQGPNEAGKTSAIDGLVAALAGKRAAPAIPVRKGQEVATIEVELSDALAPCYQVQRWFKGDRTGLNVYAIGADGERGKVAGQQTLLDSLVSDLSFDPLAFAKTTDPKAQRKLLMSAIGRPDLSDGVEARKTALAEERRQINAKVKTLEVELAGPFADPAPGETLTVATDDAIKARLDAAERQNAAKRATAQRIVEADGKATQAQQQVDAIAEQIKKLQGQQAQWMQALGVQQAASDKLHAELESLPAEISTAEITADMAKVQAVNERARRQGAHRAKKLERDTAAKQADALTAKLEAADQGVVDVLVNSNIGKSIPGLSFVAGELYHNGVPFSQASGMRRLELSTLIGMAANPRLRVMCIDEGDQLDDASLARLKALAKERDYQVLMTAIRAGDESDDDTRLIKISDGRAMQAAPLGESPGTPSSIPTAVTTPVASDAALRGDSVRATTKPEPATCAPVLSLDDL
jgi:hypothetical protein